MATALQCFAVSALIGECQSLLDSGSLNPSQEASLRCLPAHTQNAFDVMTQHSTIAANRDEIRPISVKG